MSDYVMCVRRVRNGNFDPEPNEPGVVRFLKVPKNAKDIEVKHEVTAKREWTEEVIKSAIDGESTSVAGAVGDIVIYIHGFNTQTSVMLERHRKIRKGLEAKGFTGAVLSFDWPSDNKAINYLEDRWDAKKSAIKLVQFGIKRFTDYQRDDCQINVHVLAHSMGSYVLREAFDDADDVASIASVSWSVSQVMIISGDISASSMGSGQSKSSSLYRHSVRVTNYFNPYDEVLKLSNVKRIGVSPRLGRIGLPSERPQKAVNVNCGSHFKVHEGSYDIKFPGHNWYFEDAHFFEDMAMTIKGDLDRDRFPTRAKDRDRDGDLVMRIAPD